MTVAATEDIGALHGHIARVAGRAHGRRTHGAAGEGDSNGAIHGAAGITAAIEAAADIAAGHRDGRRAADIGSIAAAIDIGDVGALECYAGGARDVGHVAAAEGIGDGALRKGHGSVAIYFSRIAAAVDGGDGEDLVGSLVDHHGGVAGDISRAAPATAMDGGGAAIVGVDGGVTFDRCRRTTAEDSALDYAALEVHNRIGSDSGRFAEAAAKDVALSTCDL